MEFRYTDKPKYLAFLRQLYIKQNKMLKDDDKEEKQLRREGYDLDTDPDAPAIKQLRRKFNQKHSTQAAEGKMSVDQKIDKFHTLLALQTQAGESRQRKLKGLKRRRRKKNAPERTRTSDRSVNNRKPLTNLATKANNKTK